MTRSMICVLALLFASVALADDAASPASELAELLGSNADDGFAKALQPRQFVFPADHGAHPQYRNEWWYVTGNLDDEAGRRFGFELTIFRFALAPVPAGSDSAWRTNQVFIAHLALTDAEDSRFLVAQRYARGALGLAGTEAEPVRVWIDDWQMLRSADSEVWRLTASDAGFGIDLTLTGHKRPVLNGVGGLSQKSADPGNASYYYSITRLGTEGTIRIGERDYAVSGLSWLDREWSTSALAAEQVGWDWFALQFTDGSELMFYALRRADGSRDAASAGTFTQADGTASHLAADDVEVEVLDTWDSPQGGSYPARWQLRVPRLGLEAEIRPVIADQELFTTVRYWEGAVDVSGEHAGNSITGRGYVELTGYADAGIDVVHVERGTGLN